MHNPGVAGIALDHLAQELDPEDDMPRFVSRYGGEAATKRREKFVCPVEFQDTALPGKRHCALDNHMVERDALDQACQVSCFPLDGSGNLRKRIDQNIFQVSVHILTGHCQGVFQFLFVDPEHLSEEAGEENRVTSLVDQLRGEENAHLLVGHSYYIRAEGIGDTCLALEEC